MTKKTQRWRDSKSVAKAKKLAERRSLSWYMAAVFLAFFALMLFFEVFLIKDENSSYRHLYTEVDYSDYKFNNARSHRRLEIVPPFHVARELARVLSDVAPEELQEENVTSNSWKISEEPDHWQMVRGTKNKFFVFSAYFDDRRGNYIRVISAARTRIADRVVCKFWFKNGRSPVAVYATNKLIRENWNLKYSAYFILCPLQRDVGQIPDEVSIIKLGDSRSSNRLVVHNNHVAGSSAEGIAVCIKPLHYNYDKLVNLVEFIELNRILGVQHFILYNDTIGPAVNCALQYYIREGIVTVLPWKLDLISQKEIRTEGLFAALNDCLYRTMYRHRYVLMIDLDEYIIPHANTSLTDLISFLQKKSSHRVGAFSFQNSFFYLHWPNDPNSNGLPYQLITLQKTIRKTKLHAHKQRSKCIVLPERVVEMGNHFVWEFAPGRTMVNVGPDLGFLHHYRVCEFGGTDCINTTSIVDRTVYLWKSTLLDTVTNRLDDIQRLCSLSLNETRKNDTW